MKVSVLVSTFALLSLSAAQNCQVLNFQFTPVVASGYRAQLVANGLRFPRAIVFDTSGYLLVAERGAGISRFEVGSCGTLLNRQLIISDTTLNHGLTISADGRTIFASSQSTAWSWSYDPATGAVSNKRTLITGMNAGGHTTRTLYAPPSNPDLLLASWGSDGNLDWGAQNINSGRSQIRGFSISRASSASMAFTQGTVFGWGLRNSVGIGQDRGGGLWSVENSADNIQRNGQDVHNDNPAEELNYHGLASDTTTQRGNYGYPECLTIWTTTGVPNAGSLQTGQQFSNGTSSVTAAQCNSARQAPRISFPSHTAPLDIKFDSSGNAWVSFHGSWNRSPPDGYRVSVIPFGSNNQPVAASNSRTGYQDIMTNADLSRCPSACFRPVGLAFDSRGRLFISSDSTGEIYLLERTTPVTSTTTSSRTTTSTTTSSRTTTTTSRTTTSSTTSSRTTTPTTTRTTTGGGAPQPTWAQCGGVGWTGSTTCISGTTCRVLNPYYSQCLP